MPNVHIDDALDELSEIAGLTDPNPDEDAKALQTSQSSRT